jgi:tRNA U54 and U55 pseudouridine synthase Pus10
MGRMPKPETKTLRKELKHNTIKTITPFKFENKRATLFRELRLFVNSDQRESEAVY